MSKWIRTLVALMGVVAALASVAPVAYADQLHGDDLTTDGNTTKTADSTGTAKFYLQPTGNDGCNADANNPVTVTVTSNQAWVSIASPGTVSFTACKMQNNDNAETIGYTVASDAPTDGVATISGSASGGKANNDGFNHNNATFTVTIVAGGGSTDPCDSVAVPEAPAFSHTPDGTNGWFRTIPTVAASSSGANVTYSLTSGGPYGAAPTLSNGQTSVYAIATESQCNKTSSESSQLYKVDTELPDIDLVGPILDATSYYFAFVPAVPTCTASDSVSGLADADPATSGVQSCRVSGYGTSVGSHTVQADAIDIAGNTNSDDHTYTVLSWDAGGGFKSPVTSDLSKVNVVKAGSTVPLKFNVFAGQTEITDVAILGAAWSWTVKACDLGDAAVDVTGEAGSTSLRYEDGQFIRNWKTPTTKGCGFLTLTLADGSTIQAEFRVR